MAAVTFDDMAAALRRYSELVSVFDNPERPSDLRAVLRDSIGMDEVAIDLLLGYINSIKSDDGGQREEDDRSVFTAGMVLGAMILKEVQVAEVFTIPDSLPPDLTA